MRNDLVKIDIGGVYAYVVVEFVAPGKPRVKVVIPCAVSVHGLDKSTHFTLGKMFFIRFPLETPREFAFHARVNEYFERLEIFKNKVRAPSDDNAVGFLRHGFDNLFLLRINGLFLLHRI